VAVFGAWSVHRYSPDGRLDAAIRVPARDVTSVAFGGDDLDVLYITSARERLGTSELNEQPLAGALFRCRPGARGGSRHRAAPGARGRPPPVTHPLGAARKRQDLARHHPRGDVRRRVRVGERRVLGRRVGPDIDTHPAARCRLGMRMRLVLPAQARHHAGFIVTHA